MKKNILAALVSLSCALGSTVANAEDLLQVFEIATANDPTVLKAKAQADAQSYQSDRAMSALLPQIGLSMSYEKSDSTSFQSIGDLSNQVKVESETDQFRRGISLSQTLFDLGAWNSLGIADKQALQASGQYDFAKQDLIVRVAEGYFNVLSAIDNLEFVQAEKRAIERQLEQTKQRYAVGLTAITDVHEAQAQFDNSVAQEIIANNAVETAREQLREITGKYHAKLDMLNTETFSTVKPSTPATDLVKIAKDKNLNLQVSKITVDIAKEQIELAKAGHYPKLTLNASYGDSLTDSELNGVSFDDQPRSDSSSIGLNFSVPLYSGGATVAATDQARAFYVAASQDFETDYRAVTRSVITSYNQVVSDIATFKALEQAVISAQSALKATEAGFEVGTRTIVDVLISTQNLYNAKRNLADVRYRYVVSTLRLKQATGTLSREDLVGINQGLNTVN
ncbi:MULTISPECIES: outer membrane channel protein TolC [unclassified Pseudoalteromonas]|uniref:outer membrane channel protein TolC n=1 Tax=unclassified Pseudoalteromonas TaxID=194690 RepID=UPI00110D1C5A|nr:MULTISPECIES: outer membrane channel protein TolC [unclassified Pseudoalteromonas]MDN3394079.1 outer membrane channel protein TolC [Pseudoalteromonas sp. APC 3215]MDN3401760.1 outer membrane channel protein TolC [Pseudoalteromonas sp. APC 3213]MDN3431211.1 outer membrane channel protein TolC [Pseudoalteromonas sp. APC 3907]MDN3464025.1 outer membrane channel protein TolC [Pseudoalteromonas sp. APC 3495]MDN3470259.1 outer membrane channel protein TolC [Pseudoalteromonas sp. APC 4026]